MYICIYCCCCLVTKSLFCNPMDYIAHQTPLSMGLPRQDHWSGLPFPSLEDLPNPGIEPRSPALQADFFYRLSYMGNPV